MKKPKWRSTVDDNSPTLLSHIKEEFNERFKTLSKKWRLISSEGGKQAGARVINIGAILLDLSETTLGRLIVALCSLFLAWLILI